MEKTARFINETDFAAHRIVRTNGEITIDGLYPEKQAGRHMVRIRITGGRITLDQGYALADLAEQYADHEWHVDTRQNIELHGVKAENIIPLLEAIEAKAGLTTRGSCGDTVRNVIVGAEADRFSPNGKDRPLQAMADAITKYFAGNPEFETLPRKFKIAIYGLEDREPLHRLHDIGFLEEVRSDVSLPLTFSIWIGGGLGKAPRLGDLFFRGVPAGEAVKLVEAVVRVFHDHGNRKNRAQARFKWVLTELGPEKVRELILQRWTPPEGVDIEPVLSEDGQGLSTLHAGGIHLQADGRYRVYVPLIAGDIDTTTARRVLDIARQHGARELQLGTRQNIAIPDVEPGKEDELARALAAIGYAPEGWGGPSDVVACPGADQCRKAFVETRNFAKDYAKALDALGAPAWAKRIRIGMSGCPNSCTMPHINGLGFRGSVGRVDGKTRQGFDLLLGGSVDGGTTLGEEIANYLSHDEVIEVTKAAIQLFHKLGNEREPFGVMLKRVGVGLFARRLKAAVPLSYGVWKLEVDKPLVSVEGAPTEQTQVELAAIELSPEKPRAILEWALNAYGDSLLITTALNAGGVLLLRYLKELGDSRAT
ncbi:MAG: nitrite/sulfite reductase, partial [Planctomycetes bacterium]|nr:nitrite/sulfite reductase [Planctomycetota bacterium]